MSTIRRVEELRAMPLETLVLASDGEVYRKSPMWERHGHAVWEGFESADHDDDVRLNAEQVPLPAETLHPRTVSKAEARKGMMRGRGAIGQNTLLSMGGIEGFEKGFYAALAALGIEVVENG